MFPLRSSSVAVVLAALLVAGCSSSKSASCSACHLDTDCAVGGESCRLGVCVPAGFDASRCAHPTSTSTSTSGSAGATSSSSSGGSTGTSGSTSSGSSTGTSGSGSASSSGSSSGSTGGALYSLSVSAPQDGATLSGLVTVSGSAPGMQNVEVWDASHVSPPLARVTPQADGRFSTSVDTALLPDGPDTWTVHAWDSPAGQSFNHQASQSLSVTLSNGNDGGSSGGLAPLGGPAGYSTLVMSDSFGSSKPGATVSDVAQFNPSTAYGAAGSGWDLFMAGWGEPSGTYANVVMMSDHLEIYPDDTSNAGFIVSHFEPLPTATTSYYLEFRIATGRGEFQNHTQTWPAIWLFSGNEPGNVNAQSEIDVMETYADLAHGDPDPNDPNLYDQYFQSTSHPDASQTNAQLTVLTPGIDVTTSYNVYGCELTLVNGNVHWAIYFNGVYQGESQSDFPWASSPPAMILGWNPGSTTASPAVMRVDWVRAWQK